MTHIIIPSLLIVLHLSKISGKDNPFNTLTYYHLRQLGSLSESLALHPRPQQEKVFRHTGPVWLRESEDECSTTQTQKVLLYSSNHFCRLMMWPPLWTSGQSYWLQIQRAGFDSRRYQIFGVVVGLERGPLSLVSTTEELTEWYV
jgi:hypothetical protein